MQKFRFSLAVIVWSTIATIAVAVTETSFPVAPSNAQAARSTVVLKPFSGPRGVEATRALKGMLQRRYSVSSSETSRAVAIISGSLAMLKGRWTLTIRIANSSGRRLGQRVFPLRSSRLDPSTARRVVAAIGHYVDTAKPSSETPTIATATQEKPKTSFSRRKRTERPPKEDLVQDDAEETDDRSTTDEEQDFLVGDDASAKADQGSSTSVGSQKLETDEENDVASRKTRETSSHPEKQSSKQSSREPGRVTGSSTTSRRNSKPEPRLVEKSEKTSTYVSSRTWISLIEISAGLRLISRSFRFNQPRSPANPPNYSTQALAPAVLVQAALFPFARSQLRGIAPLGFAGRYARVLGLKSQHDETLLPTSMQQVEVGARYRWKVLSNSTGLIVVPRLEFGQSSFAITDGLAQLQLPDITYTYLQIGVGAEWGLITKPSVRFVVQAKLDVLPVFSTGKLSNPDASGYGKGTTFGIDASLGLRFIYKSLFIEGDGFLRRIGIDFDETCVQSTGCRHAGGAVDVYTGFQLSVGYRY